MLKKIFITAAAGLLIVNTAYASLDTAKPIKDAYVIIFVMDGLNYDTFVKALETGSTPNIEKYFLEDGAYFTSTVSLFPSVSAPVYQSFISGLLPGHAGIPYLAWFDRATKRPIDYLAPKGQRHLDQDFLNLKALLNANEKGLYPPSTIFEHLKGSETAGVYSVYNSGAAIKKPKVPVAALWSALASGREEMLDRYAFKTVEKLFRLPAQKAPRFTLVGLYSFDTLGHHFGAGSPIITYNMEQFDQFLGSFISLLRKRGIFEKTYIILIGDHGMHDTKGSRFDLEKFVRDTGLTLYKPSIRKREAFDAFVADRGLASAHIYIRGNNGWEERPSYETMRDFKSKSGESVDIIQRLEDANEIKFVIARDGFHRTHVFSKELHGLITHMSRGTTDMYKYETIAGDPLEMTSSGARRLVNNGFHTMDEWLRLTANHKYPDAVTQLAQIFADGRSGDIFVIAGDEWVFYRGKQATHGSIIREDMHVPLMMRGPEVRKGRFEVASVANIYPTILDWFGIKVSGDNYDGQHLFKKLKIKNQKLKIEGQKLEAWKAELENSRKKLEMIYSDMEKRLENGHDLVREANMLLIREQIKRINEDAKTLFQ